MITPADLRTVAALAALSDDALGALAARAEDRAFAAGDVVAPRGAPADFTYALLAGTVVFTFEREGQDQGAFTIRTGMMSGWLPRSRMTTFPGTGRAAEPARLAVWPRAFIERAVEDVAGVEDALAGVLNDRIRDATRTEQQRDKLAALGKLAAGLAHELNNPAAAVRRAAEALRERLDALPAHVRALAQHGLDPDQLQFACTLPLSVRPEAPATLSPVARGEQEDAVADWLDAHGLPHSDALAGTFVDADWDTADLDDVARGLPPNALPDVVRWTEATLAADLLLRDLASAADRISDLVRNVKGYSHMDEAAARAPADLHEGLDQTVKLLAYPIRSANVRVERRYAEGLPPVDGYAGMLNQVWTNLLDNALDAMPHGGTLTLTTRPDGPDHVCVEVADTGTGIPPEVVRRIFEPFFTTKGVGEGTGLGLDVARRIVEGTHGGSLNVRSTVGAGTTFTVRLPLRSFPVPDAAARPEEAEAGEAVSTATALSGPPPGQEG